MWQTVLLQLSALLTWCQAHPTESLETALLVWSVLNVLWAQLPRPKNPTAQRLWDGIHSVLQLAVTHSSEPGTFRLPWFLRLILRSGVLPAGPTEARPEQATKPE